MPKTECDIDRNCVHLAGEYFVAAELSKRGYAVGITMGNAKAIDILAEKDCRSVNIQVKAIRGKFGWPIMKDRVKTNVIYVFVALNAEGVPPDYAIMTSKETRSNIQQYETRGVLRHSVAMRGKYKERWDKIEPALR